MNGNIFDLKYKKRFPFIVISKKNLFAIFFISMLVGIFGFISETIIELIETGYICDRGFLVGPFIPIYFFSVLLGLLFIKTPKRTIKNFILSTLIIGTSISLIEFVVGNICELIFKVQLWTYDYTMPLSYKYVSLSVGVIWGIIGSFFVMFILPLLKKIADKIDEKYYFKIFYLFLVCFLSDFIISIILVIKNGEYQELYKIKLFK